MQHKSAAIYSCIRRCRVTVQLGGATMVSMTWNCKLALRWCSLVATHQSQLPICFSTNPANVLGSQSDFVRFPAPLHVSSRKFVARQPGHSEWWHRTQSPMWCLGGQSNGEIQWNLLVLDSHCISTTAICQSAHYICTHVYTHVSLLWSLPWSRPWKV